MNKKRPKNHKEQLIIQVHYHIDDDGNYIYDFEYMTEVFNDKLKEMNKWY